MRNLLITYSILLAMVLISLTGCGKDGSVGPAGPIGPAYVPPVVSADSDVLDVVENGAHGNEYREGLGQTELSLGMSCSAVHISSGNWLSTASPGYVAGQSIVTTGTNYTYRYSGGFNQPDASSGVNNMIPTSLQQLFAGTNYRISCTGYIVITSPGWYEFEVTSDDGSVIYLDGATLYNDGNHGVNATPATQSVYFTRDVHSFRVDYAQTGGGNFGMMLTRNNASIPNNILYH